MQGDPNTDINISYSLAWASPTMAPLTLGISHMSYGGLEIPVFRASSLANQGSGCGVWGGGGFEF